MRFLWVHPKPVMHLQLWFHFLCYSNDFKGVLGHIQFLSMRTKTKTEDAYFMGVSREIALKSLRLPLFQRVLLVCFWFFFFKFCYFPQTCNFLTSALPFSLSSEGRVKWGWSFYSSHRCSSFCVGRLSRALCAAMHFFIPEKGRRYIDYSLQLCVYYLLEDSQTIFLS